MWWNARAAETPVFVQTLVERLPDDLERLRQEGTKLVVIDTPPALTSTIIEVVRVSDLVVIPIQPSPHDLRAAGATVDLVECLNKPLVFVFNCAHARARITTEAAIALSQHGTLASSVIHQRTNFASSMIDGRTVMEIPKAERSAAEIVALWDYLTNRLARVQSAAASEAQDAAPAVVPEPERAVQWIN